MADFCTKFISIRDHFQFLQDTKQLAIPVLNTIKTSNTGTDAQVTTTALEIIAKLEKLAALSQVIEVIEAAIPPGNDVRFAGELKARPKIS